MAWELPVPTSYASLHNRGLVQAQEISPILVATDKGVGAFLEISSCDQTDWCASQSQDGLDAQEAVERLTVSSTCPSSRDVVHSQEAVERPVVLEGLHRLRCP